MKKEQLLAEVEDILRSMPSRELFIKGEMDAETVAWVGRAVAVIDRWNLVYSVEGSAAAGDVRAKNTSRANDGALKLHMLLCQARADLRMEVGQLSVVVPQGQVFDYFDQLRKVIEMARFELFFVDPYLDAEFVSRFLPHVASGVPIRLLGRKNVTKLCSAVELFAQQASADIHVRSSSGLHDRFVFIDQSACYQSGASFKDGAKNAPATFTQITDAFQAMWDTYERLWADAVVER